MQNVHHLVATVHLQWAGFEVGGTDEEVLRYWFSVLKGLQASGLKLVHGSAGEGHSVLKQTTANARSSYTLSWVNTRRWHSHMDGHMHTPDIVDGLKEEGEGRGITLFFKWTFFLSFQEQFLTRYLPLVEMKGSAFLWPLEGNTVVSVQDTG